MTSVIQLGAIPDETLAQLGNRIGGQQSAEDDAAEEGSVQSAERAARWSEPRISCALCGGQSFPSFLEQRAHWTGLWHAANVRRHKKALPVLSLEDYQKLAAQNLEDSSDDDDDDGDGDENQGANQVQLKSPRLYYPLQNGYLSIWKALLAGEKAEVGRCPDLLTAVARSPPKMAVFLFGGGHFAGAVFARDNGAILASKTYHRYTTRRKQGGSQTSNDKASRAKSAGASIRRQEAAALRADVRNLLDSWRTQWLGPNADGQGAAIVFTRVPNVDRALFFGDDKVGLDPAMSRRVPFPTARPTLDEVKRVYSELLTAKVERYLPPGVRKAAATAAQPTVGRKPAVLIEMPKVKPVGQEPDPDVAELMEVFKQLCQGRAGAVSQLTSDNLNMPFPAGFKFKRGTNKKMFTAEGLTALDAASQLNRTAVVTALLERGADPVSTRPFSRASDKETRNAFRRYWHHHPDKWDYGRGGIPSALSPEMEAKEAARAEAARQRSEAAARAREEKEAECAAAEQAAAAEADAQLDKRIKYSERERRAMAAEVRAGSRCATCYEDLRRLVPFDKNAKKFCSLRCVAEGES